MNKIESYRRYPSNVEIVWSAENGDHGTATVELNSGADFGDATWTDAEAEEAAREILREHGLDDKTADSHLVSLVAEQFPRHARAAKRYAVIDRRRDYTGDEFVTYHESEAEAVAAAERQWNHLTSREQAARTVCVCVSEENEDGEFDHGNYDVIKSFPVKFEARLVSNGDYMQWVRDGRSYPPPAKKTSDNYDSEAEAERAGEELWPDRDELDHIVVWPVEL